MTTVSTARAFVLGLAAAVAMPAAAQMAATPPAAAGPTTDQLNAASSAYSQQRDDVRQMDETAEHRADRDAYIAALVAHDRAVDRTNARYARQQMAYTDAMAAWRQQVAACHHGDDRACKAPTPQVADFY